MGLFRNTLFLLLLLSLNSFSQAKNQVNVGYMENYEKLPKISFEKTTALVYEQYNQGKMQPKIKLKERKSKFLITVKGKPYWLKKYDPDSGQDGFKGYEFMNYFPKLNMYALTSNSTAEHLGFSDMILVDSLTNFWYSIVSIGDGAVETPIPSVNNKYLLYFYNEVYQPNRCMIGVLKLNNRKNPSKLLTAHRSFESSKWAVDQLHWIDDQSFLVKAVVSTKADGKRSEHFEYYKGTIDSTQVMRP